MRSVQIRYSIKPHSILNFNAESNQAIDTHQFHHTPSSNFLTASQIQMFGLRTSTSKLVSAVTSVVRGNFVPLSANMANSNIAGAIGLPKNFSTEALKVQHEPKNSRFVIQLGKAIAVLEYVEGPPGVLDMYHTGVPGELQGKGIAKILAQEAFDYIVRNNMKMKLSCSYLQKYLNDNPKEDYKQRVVK